jgi:alanine dehydrogenase
MLIGVPKEIKTLEYRVGLVPSSVHELVRQGHQVMVEKNAGEGIQCYDADYEKAGAEIVSTPDEIFARAEMIVKVKEPQASECKKLRPGQILFTYLHLAADAKQAELLCESGSMCIAYETVTDDQRGLPLLSPMSEVAGRLSIQVGAHCLEKTQGGRGVLLGGVPGVRAGHVVVIGGGVVGTNALRMAIGMEARVTVLDTSLRRLKELDSQFGSRLNTAYATSHEIARYIAEADLVVGAVLVPGAMAPKLVTREMLKYMHRGAVIVDVAIDQGGCFETARPTTHADPTYVEEGVVHYCVTNMPGAVPRTSAFALNNATLPYVLAIANKGAVKALRENKHLMQGLNVYEGQITHSAVAHALGLPYAAPEALLK